MIDKATKTKLLKKYAENLEKSENRNHYLSYARDFLDHAGGLDRASIDQYIEDLQERKVPSTKEKYKAGTINFAFRVIRRLFAVNKLDWEYRKGEAPVIGQRDEYRPQLSPKIIGMMILAAKNSKLFPVEKCFLALSTTYGLRREEIANTQPQDVNIEGGHLYVATLKHGRQRYHLIPPEIQPYLAEHDFSQRYAVATVSQMFRRILTKSGAGVLRNRKLGWHAIRRPVLEGLINNGVNILAAHAFLRWKSATGDLSMPTRYYGNEVVDLDGTEPVLNEAKGDEDIFKLHPFLPLWRDNA